MTVPITVRMAARQVGMFINIVSAATKNKEMNVLRKNVFERIVLTILPLGFCEMRIKGSVVNVKIIIRQLVRFTDQSLSGG